MHLQFNRDSVKDYVDSKQAKVRNAARQAVSIFLAEPSAKEVIVSDDAPTSRGYRLCNTPTEIVYYRKASTGKWGKCASKRYVLPTSP